MNTFKIENKLKWLFYLIQESNFMNSLYITGAGVSKQSGIPTFRGEDGFWTIGSTNYTPQEMATRQMYCNQPDEFLLWYYQRFVTYKDVPPNIAHFWLADKRLITQNIDGLDGRAGNKSYIAIHGRLDKVTIFRGQDQHQELLKAPWDDVANLKIDSEDHARLKRALLESFKISTLIKRPEKEVSLKPFILLFDEYYTNLYRMRDAERWMMEADKMVFIGTSFSVNITSIALRLGLRNSAAIEIVDPEPVDLGIASITYHSVTAEEYISSLNY